MKPPIQKYFPKLAVHFFHDIKSLFQSYCTTSGLWIQYQANYRNIKFWFFICEWGWDIYHWMQITDVWGITVSISFIVCLRRRDRWAYWLDIINQMINPYRIEMWIPLDKKETLRLKHLVLSVASAFFSLLVRDFFLLRICLLHQVCWKSGNK